MIHLSEFSTIQQKIIRKICKKQLASLNRLLDGNGHNEQDIIMVLIENDLTEDEFKETLIERMHAFEIINADPQQLPSMKETDVSVFRHCLFNMEHLYKEKYPKSIANLWNRLFLLEEFNNQQKLIHNLN